MRAEVEGGFRVTTTGLETGDKQLLSQYTTTAEVFPFKECMQSEWAGKSAGGAYKSSSQTFKHNPLFTLTVDEDDTDVCLVLRQHRKKQSGKISSGGAQRGYKWHTIGLYLFECSAQLQSLKTSDKIAASTFINLPEVCSFLPSTKKLGAGAYLIVCTTYESKLQAKFTLTALSNKQCYLEKGRTESAKAASAAVASKKKTKTKKKKKGRDKKKGKKAGSTISFQKARNTQTMMTDLYAQL